MAGCSACTAPTDPIDLFCGRCGSGLAGVAAIDPGLSRFCHGCGGSLEPDARFCRSCGAQAPEPVENVFAGMEWGGHDVITLTEPVADLVAHNPSRPEMGMARTGSARSRVDRQRRSPRPAIDDARTESIPRPAPSASQAEAEPSVETVTRMPRPRSMARVATATIERTPVQHTPLVRDTAAALTEETDEEELETALSPGTGFPWGGTLALLGALAVILSAIVDWGGPFRASLPRDISATWLLEPAASPEGPSLGVLLLVAGTLGALVALVAMAAPGFTFLRRFVGLVTLMVPVGFGLRTVQSLAEESSLSELPSALGLGVVMAAAGGSLLLAARRPRRAHPQNS